MDEMNAFLTEVDSKLRDRHHPKLANVRKEHAKLMEVVAAFGDKVNNMVDRQRTEYMHAYEQHMYDVQKELHNLREKVTEIANDKTRDEKIQQLSSDQIKFRHEALFYDDAAADLRKKIRRLKDTLQGAEKERDWLLKKLREEKKRYNYLKEERAKMANMGDSNSSLASNDSSYSLELIHNRAVAASQPAVKKGGNREPSSDWRSRLEADITAVSRDQGIITTLPLLVPPPSSAGGTTPGGGGGGGASTTGKSRAKHSFDLIATSSGFVSGGGLTSGASMTSNAVAEKRALGELVSLRARQEGVRDFVGQCVSCCGRGIWNKIPRRSIDELLRACNDLLTLPPSSTIQERIQLAQELAVSQDTYFALSDILTGKFDPERVNRQAAETWGLGYGSRGLDAEELRGLELELEGDDGDGDWTQLDLDNLGDDDVVEQLKYTPRTMGPPQRSPSGKLDVVTTSKAQSQPALQPVRLSGNKSTSQLQYHQLPSTQVQPHQSLTQSMPALPRITSVHSIGSTPLLDADTIAYFQQVQREKEMAARRLAEDDDASIQRWLQSED